jgi:hypothetical protein
MSRTGAERARAARLRKKLKISKSEREWLLKYEQQGQEQMPLTGVKATEEVPVVDYGTIPEAIAVDQPEEGQKAVPDRPVIEPEPVDDSAERTASAAKVAALVTLVVSAGIESVDRLAKAGALPPPLQSAVSAGALEPSAKKLALEIVHDAVTRLALKWGVAASFRYEDECVVAVALLGSSAAIWAERKLISARPVQGNAEERPKQSQSPTSALKGFYR